MKNQLREVTDSRKSVREKKTILVEDPKQTINIENVGNNVITVKKVDEKDTKLMEVK